MRLAMLAFAGLAIAAGAGHAQDAQVLLQKYDCTLCHASDETKTGPAFVDVAAKYRGNPNGATILAAVVRKGVHGSGPWPMPPLPQVPPDDAKRMVDYILALGK